MERFHQTLFAASLATTAALAILLPPEEVAWLSAYYGAVAVFAALSVLSLAAMRALALGREWRLTTASFWFFVAGLLLALTGLFVVPGAGLSPGAEPVQDILTTSSNHLQI